MTFILQIKIDAERASDIDQKAIEASCNGEVVAINPRPQVQTNPVRLTPSVKS